MYLAWGKITENVQFLVYIVISHFLRFFFLFFFPTCRSIFDVRMIHELTVISVRDSGNSISKGLGICSLGFKIQIQMSWIVSLYSQWKSCCRTKHNLQQSTCSSALQKLSTWELRRTCGHKIGLRDISKPSSQ